MHRITFFLLIFFLAFFWHTNGQVSVSTDDLQKTSESDPLLVNNRMMADNMLIGQLYTTPRYISGGRMHDSFAILYSAVDPDDKPGMYDNAINQYDAVKLFNFYENIAVDHAPTYLSIERRRMPVDGERYKLYTSGYTHEEWTLLMTVQSMEHIVFYLDDAFTGESFMLNTGIHPYHFTVSNAQPESMSTSRFSVRATERAAFVLPYTNAFDLQDDFNEALALGFQFNDTSFQPSDGGFVEIADGSVISPKIDFSAYNALKLSFKISTGELRSGQKLSVSISNDDGLTYQVLDVLDVPLEYTEITQYIDLSSLNGTSGRIKLEMTAGTGTIQLREFYFQEFNGYLYSNGNWSPSDPNGVSTSNDDIAIINRSTTFTAATQVENLHIMEGATLNVENVLTISGNINNQGNLIFVSSEAVNGELGPVPAGSTITGNATVQSYMSYNRSYRMVSSSVSTTTSIHDNWQEGADSNTHDPNPGFGTHITGTTVDQQNGFDATATGNPSMFTVAGQAFVAVSNTDVDPLNAGEPYLLFVRGDRNTDLSNNTSAGETILRATGTLQYGIQNPQDFPTVNAGEFAMFGNPYQSAVDIVSVFASGGTNVNNAHYYVYDPTQGTHGAYVTVTLPNGENTGTSTADRYLQPGQGAQFATSGNGVSSLVFTEANKASGHFTTTSATGDRLASDNMLTVQLYTTENFNNGGPTHDSFGIIFGDGLDNGITSADAVKPMNLYENLGINHNGTYLSLERREMPQPAEVYPLYSSGYNHIDYTLKMIIDGLEETFLYLDDHFTRTSTLLEGGETVYRFAIDATDPMSIATDRFSVRTEARLGIDNNGLLSGVGLFPNPLNDNTFYINAPKLNGEIVTISVNDMLGREIYNAQHTFSDNSVKVELSQDVVSGIYMVTLSSKGENRSLRIIKR